MNSTMHLRLPAAWLTVALILLVGFPYIATIMGLDFYIGFVTRLLIFGIAASSLNLILGYGGMVSLGHAAYFGAGAYAVAILMHHGFVSAWLSWPVAILTGAVLAFLIGSVCLRTRGVYFIMITLAFAQMVYYVFVSLRSYGGDDGLSLSERSAFNIGSLDLGLDTHFYYVVLLLFTVSLYLMYRLINSRFGRVLQAIRENETRAQAIGYPVYRYKLVGFTLAGAMAALAGALFANLNYMASPSQLHWMESGILIVMVILGGMGAFLGGVLGAAVLLILEEILAAFTPHWPLIVGFILLGIVLFLPNGLASIPTLLRHKRKVDVPKKNTLQKEVLP